MDREEITEAPEPVERSEDTSIWFTMEQWISRQSADRLKDLSFSDTPPEDLALSCRSYRDFRFRYKACGHYESRRARYILDHSIRGSTFHCRECRRSAGLFRVWLADNAELIDDSQLTILNPSEDLLESNASAKMRFEVDYGACGHRETTTFASLKTRARNVRDLGQEQLLCSSCKVSTGGFELTVRSWLQGRIFGEEGISLSHQPRIVGISQSMRYDLLLELSDSYRLLIEVDGGQHYGEGFRRKEDDFKKRIETDRIKTQAALDQGYYLLRIDARKYRTEVPDELAHILRSAAKGELSRYTVFGEECPGAALVQARGEQ